MPALLYLTLGFITRNLMSMNLRISMSIENNSKLFGVLHGIIEESATLVTICREYNK